MFNGLIEDVEEVSAAHRSGGLRLGDQKEGVARALDAGFAPERLPQGLKELRTRVVEALGGRA